MKIKSANGVSGFLLWTGETYVFRVYEYGETDNGHTTLVTFTDYDIRHWDLEITITDPSAALYEREDGPIEGQYYIDYTREVLGND